MSIQASSIYTTAALVLAGSIAAVAVGSLGLQGHLSMTAVGISSVVTSITNPIASLVQFIIGILGLTGTLPMAAVSGVLIGCGALGILSVFPYLSLRKIKFELQS